MRRLVFFVGALFTLAAVAALKSKAVKEQFAKVGGIAAPGTSEEYRSFIAAEQAKCSKIVQAIGFKE